MRSDEPGIESQGNRGQGESGRIIRKRNFMQKLMVSFVAALAIVVFPNWKPMPAATRIAARVRRFRSSILLLYSV